jgi:hypothetical protein
MRLPLSCLAICLGLGLVACKNNDVTGTGGALASLTVDAPDSAHSGVSFDIAVRALAIGVTNVHNGHVDVTLPAPLTVSAVDASAGTTASFTNSTGGGAQVSWNLGTLDSNTQSTLHITAAGTLAAGSAPQTLTVRATLTADGIRPGEAVADDNVQLIP